jgi:hypothetical protein
MSAVRFVFTGDIVCSSFIEFADHRARRLDLGLEMGACSKSSVAMTVTGQEVLLDMFEMACSLGPYNCIVRQIERTQA